jgi:23S rRNA pseudouridine1911/1915/1917 synthase
MENVLRSRILFCNTDCVAVNKIAGEAVEGAGKGMIDLPRLLATELSAPYYPPVPSEGALALPTAVHRLDVPVSGCVVFARTAAALSFLNTAFSGGGVKKCYWAIVESSPDSTLFAESAHNGTELVHWIRFDPRRNKSVAYDEPGPGRKKAILRCRQAGAGEHYQFLEIELITGRHHQIRAQLGRLGLHIKGDLKYGARRSERDGGIRLHARSLSFPSENGECISVQADPPLRDNLWLAFEAALNQ